MLVLLGPDFDGTPDAYARLARVTGMVAYDLRARIRAGAWGVVKALADSGQAEMLAKELAHAGFRPALVPREIADSPERKIVRVRAAAFGSSSFSLDVDDREMPVEYAAVACIVRGEVQPGRAATRGAGSISSGSSFRAVTAPGELAPLREGQLFESYQAADIHFLTVGWVARIDAKAVASANTEPSIPALEAFVDDLAGRCNVRVDRSLRTSSVASFAEQAATPRTTADVHGPREHRREQPDSRFDGYSRIIGEAERRSRGAAVVNAG